MVIFNKLSIDINNINKKRKNAKFYNKNLINQKVSNLNIKKKANIELLVSVFWLAFYILNIILLARSVLYPKPGKILGVAVYAAGLIVPVICFICVWILRKQKRVIVRAVFSTIAIIVACAVMTTFTYLFVWMTGFWRDTKVYMSPIKSSTQSFDHYLIFDEEVAEWDQSRTGIFPDKVPENTDDFNYYYSYKPGMFSTVCLIRVEWTPGVDTFESEKRRIDSLEEMSFQENGTHRLYYDSNYSPQKNAPILWKQPTCYVDFNIENRRIVYTLSCAYGEDN